MYHLERWTAGERHNFKVERSIVADDGSSRAANQELAYAHAFCIQCHRL